MWIKLVSGERSEDVTRWRWTRPVLAGCDAAARDRVFRSQGHLYGKYLAMTGLGQSLPESSTAPIPTSLIFRFIHLVCSEEGIEDIGILAGQSTSLHVLGEFGQRLPAAGSGKVAVRSPT